MFGRCHNKRFGSILAWNEQSIADMAWYYASFLSVSCATSEIIFGKSEGIFQCQKVSTILQRRSIESVQIFKGSLGQMEWGSLYDSQKNRSGCPKNPQNRLELFRSTESLWYVCWQYSANVDILLCSTGIETRDFGSRKRKFGSCWAETFQSARRDCREAEFLILKHGTWRHILHGDILKRFFSATWIHSWICTWILTVFSLPVLAKQQCAQEKYLCAFWSV